MNLALSVGPDADPNANGVVLDQLVVLQGQTSADAKLNITITALDMELNPVESQTISVEAAADARGRFFTEQPLFFGLNQRRRSCSL